MENPRKGGVRTPYGAEGAAAVGNEAGIGRERAGKRFEPRYIFTPRLIGRLALGELAIEPVLGPARVAEVTHGEVGDHEPEQFVFVRWRDEHGPSTAQGRYQADSSFEVRMPAQEDRQLVRHAIDQAQWHRREITDDVARLIAAHLHPGDGSSMHRFMIDGKIEERVYDELDIAARHRLYARDWINAFTRYSLAREDVEQTGPIEAWVVRARAHVEAEQRAEQWLTASGVDVRELEELANGRALASGNGKINGERVNNLNGHPGVLARKTIKTETAVELIQAAFQLGMEMGRSGRARRAQRLLGQQAIRAA
jgi:hypothetical protein